MNSKRKYSISICDNSGLNQVETTFGYILEQTKNKHVPAYEWVYAMQDIIDSVLDLKVGESMYFQSNRDNDESKGIILRIS